MIKNVTSRRMITSNTCGAGVAKNENDLCVLESIIHGQNALGAVLPDDPDNRIYQWENGRLTGLLAYGRGLKGRLSLKGLDALKVLNCSYNGLNALDISHNPELRELFCCDNLLTSLDIHTNRKLESVVCCSNRLKTLTTGDLPNLKALYCFGNHLCSLDLSMLPELSDLRCIHNMIGALDVRKNPALQVLYCDNVRLQSNNKGNMVCNQCKK